MFGNYPFVICISFWQLWECILNLHPSGHTKHAGRGQATDGTSIPCPGCEFMFSRLWISVHSHLFGRVSGVPCGRALFAAHASGLSLQTETLTHLKLLKCTFRKGAKVVRKETFSHPREILLKSWLASGGRFSISRRFLVSTPRHSRFLLQRAWRFYSRARLYKSARLVQVFGFVTVLKFRGRLGQDGGCWGETNQGRSQSSGQIY